MTTVAEKLVNLSGLQAGQFTILEHISAIDTVFPSPTGIALAVRYNLESGTPVQVKLVNTQSNYLDLIPLIKNNTDLIPGII